MLPDIYIDIDHMHVVNESHGFELGNIVRIADLLTVPRRRTDAGAGCDRPFCGGVDAATPVMGRSTIRQSAVHLKIGPPESRWKYP